MFHYLLDFLRYRYKTYRERVAQSERLRRTSLKILLKILSIFTTSLELTLLKIPEKRKTVARFARGTPTPAARRLTADKARKNFFFF